jgi:polysaccharide pyruvyl transferase WcaK-like protein
VLAVSVGGDNYSYGRSAYLVTLDKKIMKLCPKTVLWGCSINPELLEGDEFKYKVKMLKKFSLITARESITYDALKRLGFTNVKYYPDPAFTLPTGEVKEPMFENGKDIVGVNISPLIRQFESGGDITMKSYEELVRYILDNTDMNVALISHVRNPVTDDTNAAKELLKAFPDEPRIKIFDEGNAVDIKGYIAKCRFFVAARTHASIAAYSNCIPTLVVGYSVKSTGIAKDLFGTDEGYVIPVQNLTDREALVKAFKGIMENEDSIRAGLTEIMPGYIEQARAVGKEIRALLGESDA